MKKNIYLTLFILNIFSVYAYNPPEIIFSQTAGSAGYDKARAVVPTTDGGYITVGTTYENGGDVTGFHGGFFDAWVVKYSAAGTISWQKALGGTGDDAGSAIYQTADGNYLMTGYTNSLDGDVEGNHGMFDFWAVKLDHNGEILWQKCYGGTNREYAIGSDFTPDGGFIMIGHALSFDGDVTGNHGWDYWVVKADADGNIQWQKCYGGTDLDFGTVVHPTSDGGYILGGQAYSNDGDITDPYGLQDYWIVKINGSGNMEWQISLGGSEEEYCNEVVQTSDGGYIINGTTVSEDGLVTGFHGANDAWVVKLDQFGKFWWQVALGSSWFDEGNSVKEMPYGYLVLNTAGANDGDVTDNHGQSDIWMVKLNYMGEMDWQHCYGGSGGDEAGNGGPSLFVMPDGGVLVAGGTYSSDGDVPDNNGSSDYWIFRTLPEGCETVSDLNTIAITSASALLNWNPVPGGIKYRVFWREQGEHVWNKKTTVNGAWLIHSLNCNTNYQWKVQTGCSATGISTFSSVQTFTTLGCREAEINNAMSIYPNPAFDFLMIQNIRENSRLMIFDLNGKLMLNEELTGQNSTIDISALSVGMYIVKIESGTEQFIEMISKE